MTVSRATQSKRTAPCGAAAASGSAGLDAHLLPPPDVLGVYIYLPGQGGVMSSLAAFQAVRTIGTVLPAEALNRAIDLRMPGQSAQDYELTPGMTVNAAVARAWDAALGAHRAWKIALDPAPQQTTQPPH